MSKRILSFILILTMLCTLGLAAAYANDDMEISTLTEGTRLEAGQGIENTGVDAWTIDGGFTADTSLSATGLTHVVSVCRVASVDAAGHVLTLEAIPAYTVSFNSNGGSAVSPLTGVAEGSVISAPVPPTKSGCRFAGWYKEEGLSTPWDFDTDTVTADCTLFADWDELNLNWSVTVQYTTGGTATATPSDNLRENDSVSIAATPGAGFEFVRWDYNNKDISLTDSTKASNSFAMPAKSVSLKAIFMPKSKLSTDYMMLMQAPSTVTMTIGAGGNMTMDNYAGWVKLGGVNITDKVDVAVKDGALVVTMKKAYLDTLELGKYQLSVGLNGFDATYLSEMFTVGKVPKTADESHVALWLAVLAMAAGTVAVMEVRKRKSH